MLSPEHIFIALYVPNDVAGMCGSMKLDHWREKAQALGGSATVIEDCAQKQKPSERRSLPVRIKQWFYYTAFGSALDTLIWDPLKGRLATYLMKVVEIEGPDGRALVPYGKLKQDAPNMDLSRPRIQELQALSFSLFEEMQAAANEHDVHLGVMIIPSKERVLYERARRLGTQLPDLYHTAVQNERAMVARYEQFFAEQGIEAVDVTPEVRSEIGGEGRPLYPLIDSGHPFASGYRAYARAACKHLLPDCNSRDEGEARTGNR